MIFAPGAFRIASLPTFGDDEAVDCGGCGPGVVVGWGANIAHSMPTPRTMMSVEPTHPIRRAGLFKSRPQDGHAAAFALT
jgi:hypothetical protein